MNTKQLTIGQPVDASNPTDEISKPGKRIGAVVVEACDAEAGLFERQSRNGGRLRGEGTHRDQNKNRQRN